MKANASLGAGQSAHVRESGGHLKGGQGDILQGDI